LRASGHLIEHGAEGEEIRAGVELFAARLLRRHIGHGSQSGARAGQVRYRPNGLRAGVGHGPRRNRELGQSEVQDLGLAARGNKDVRGLDVAVDHAAAVGSFQSVNDLNSKFKQALQRQRAGAQPGIQRHAIKQLHGDEVAAFEFVHLKDGADIVVVEVGGGAGFALKSFECDRVTGHAFGKELEGNAPAKADVFRLIDLSHAPAADHAEDAIVADCLSDHGPTLEAPVSGHLTAPEMWRPLNTKASAALSQASAARIRAS